MTLSEIETILEELAARHPNLTEALLTTMLTASGWEEKNIKDAVVLFKQKESSGGMKKVMSVATDATQGSNPVVVQTQASDLPSAPVPLPLSPAEMTFYHPDGTEEELHPVEEVPLIKNEEPKKEILLEKKSAEPAQPQPTELPITQETENIQEIDIPQSVVIEDPILVQEESKQEEVIAQVEIPQVPQKTILLEALPQLTTSAYEPESLIVQKPEIKTPPKQNHIPDDLPLIPFESSPHIWSFARYKNVFHADDAVPEEEVKAIEQRRVYIPQEKPKETKVEKLVHTEVSDQNQNEEEEITVEITPMTREDESLVFLAGIMLLAIILILGYMYSNGRL